MKITLDTASLSRELFKLQGIVSSKTTVPILQNALIEARSDGTLSFFATDLEATIISASACELGSPGRICLRAKEFYDAIKNLRTDKVTLEREDNLWVQLKAGTVRARLVGMDPDEFPKAPTTDDIVFTKVRTLSLLRMIERTLFSVSTDQGRPNLTGALVTLSPEGRLSMVSTDGHRLSMAEANIGLESLDVAPALVSGVIIPRKGLQELRRTLDVTVEYVDFGISRNYAIFSYGETQLFLRLIDGSFPNVTQVVPEEKEERKAYVGRAELLDRIKFVSLFANPKTGNLRLAFEDDTCTISAQDPDKGECVESVPIAYKGPAVRAGFNYRYLIDVLSTVDGEQVSIEMIDTLSPTVIHELEGEDGEGSLFIVMPMRI